LALLGGTVREVPISWINRTFDMGQFLQGAQIRCGLCARPVALRPGDTRQPSLRDRTFSALCNTARLLRWAAVGEPLTSGVRWQLARHRAPLPRQAHQGATSGRPGSDRLHFRMPPAPPRRIRVSVPARGRRCGKSPRARLLRWPNACGRWRQLAGF
jgi:hypothetical protein